MLSGDSALLQACESGDVYLGVARQLGFLPDSLNARNARQCARCSRPSCSAFSTGSGFRSLAVRTGISLYEAGEILARLRARFRRFVE